MNLTTTRLRISALLLGAAVILGGCETVQMTGPTREAPATVDNAEKAERDGQYVVAAREYMRLANVAQPPQKQHLELRAVEMLIKAGQPPEARALLRSISVQNIDASFAARKRILEAKLFALEGANDKAIRQLDEAAKTRNLNPSLLADVHATRAQIELALDNPIGAVRNLIAREALIVGKEAVAENQTQIWKILNAMPRTRLASERQLTGDPILGGWIDLALVAVDNAAAPKRLEEALAQWRALNLKHPASESLVATVTKPPAPGVIGRVERIALLLPLSSPYSVAAQAVRDGFLAMYTTDTGPDRPSVKIYDIGADANLAPDYYQAAAKDGAQVIVGPLGREAVDNVIRRGVVSVPTLLLSHSDDEAAANKQQLFQFGLPPEQEARQVAERAYLDGHRQAAVLTPQNAWGERMASAFVSTWQSLGGVIATSGQYREEESDHSEAIKRMLNINFSIERKERLERTIRMKIPFESQHARPRQDVDFIFLAADAKSGRLIKPQLNFFQAGRVPVYATSHIYTGKNDPLQDADLDGVLFGDMPWMLINNGKLQQLRQKLQVGWPHAFSDLDRLYALGMDSYAILPHLNRISAEAGVRFNGVTSGLSLDRTGRLLRSLTWARFTKGVPKLVDTSSPRPGRFDLETPSGG
jgi:outer membrane PBP1 activator LpoA protein